MRWGSSNQSRERNRRAGRVLSAAMVDLSLLFGPQRGRCRGGRFSEGLYRRRQDGQLGDVGPGGQGREEEAGLRHVLRFEAEVADLLRGRLGTVVQDRGV